jgi:tetratricopeptide (TPR) repeat protein
LLYELLAGSTPFGRKRLNEAAFDEMLRIIREEEPPKPSTRLSSSDALPSIAANRSLEPLKLNRLVQGELDWIVMKALEKDRNRRYGTATGLAQDIGHYLADEQVQACPPSAGYRLRKFARRNKAAVLMTAVISASLIAATSVSVWQAAIARDALRLAETRLESETRARMEADAAKQQAKNQATRAEAEAEKATTSAQTAQAVIDFLNRDLLGQANDNLPRDEHNRADGELTLRGALDRAAEKLEGRFPDKPLVEAAIRYTIGLTYLFFGDEFFVQAEPHLAKASELRRIHLGNDELETIRSLMLLAYVRRDVQLQRDAVEHARRALGEEHELTQWCKFNLAVGLMQISQDAEAISLLREVLVAQRRTLGSQHPDTAWTAHCLAGAMDGAADAVPADDPEIENLYREALSVSLQSRGDWSWHTSDIALRLGQFLRSRGRLEEAEKILQDGYARLESGPVNMEWALPLIAELEALYQQSGKPDQVAQWRQKRELATQKGLARNSRLFRENLNDPGLLISHGSLLSQIGQYEEAEAAYRLAIHVQPDDARLQRLLGDLLAFTGQWDKAIPAFRRAVELEPDGQPEARYRLAALCLYTGDLDGYHATCREMLERFGMSDDRNFIDRTAKVCLLAAADENRDRAIALADQNILGTEKHPDYRWFVLAKGLADYRAGRNADAVEQLEQFAPDAGGGHSDATGFAVLAMAKHGLQQLDQARNALASARAILSNTMPNPANGQPFGNDWNDWLHSQILFREAAEMVEQQASESKSEAETGEK